MSDEDKEIPAAAPDDDPFPSEVSHTPIIITDGSSALEFTESSYDQDVNSNVNTANEPLHLVSMTSDREHTPQQGDFTCFEFQAGEQYEIEAKCAGGGGFNDYKIRGGLDPQPPPEIEFDRGEYQQGPQFPPRNPATAHRFGSGGRRVTKVRIFRLVNGQRQHPALHDCPLVSVAGNGWTIHDDHVTHDEHPDHPDVVNEDEAVQPV
jgi:hypothetical protein